MKKNIEKELRDYISENVKEISRLKGKLADTESTESWGSFREDGMPNCRTVSLSERIDKIEKKIKDAESKTDELFSLPGIQIMIKAEKIKQLIKVRDAQSKGAREEIKKLKKEIEELGGKK